MSTVLITGCSGFLGQILTRHLLELGFDCLGIDLHPCEVAHPRFFFLKGDIRSEPDLKILFSRARIDAVMHVAAVLAHERPSSNFLWTSNVDGTRLVAEFCKRYRVPKIVFTSSNCLWGESLNRPVVEEDEPNPVELYGRSKWEAEKALLAYSDDLAPIIIRPPTILEAGRLGLLAILFEFIDEGRRVWVVGDGSNRYQFIYAMDLIEAMVQSLALNDAAVFGIGSDNPKSLEVVYRYVIERSGSDSRIGHLPKNVAVPMMKLAHKMGISPLGPYHYKMIAAEFSFDTTKIKRTLGWRPTLTNEEMLYRAYEYYRDNRANIHSRTAVSAHRMPASMGIIRVMKWVS
ncbi:MAG: NAD-dependent epimerase/dehydratase family protein [Bryobacteraceae bacterium]